MYQIAYHKLSEPTREEDLNCTDGFIDIVSLDMNTDYIFKIKAYTTRGSGPWSNKLHFRTFGKSKCCLAWPTNDYAVFFISNYWTIWLQFNVNYYWL